MSNSLSISTRILIIQVKILLLVQNVLCNFCAASCKCEFDEIWDNNKATCTYADSSIDIKLSMKDIKPQATFKCAGPPINITSTSDIPKFQTHSSKIILISTGCSESVRHLASCFFDLKKLETLTVTDLAVLETADWPDLDQVWDLLLYLKDCDQIPLYAFNSLPALKKLYINGGDFNGTNDIENMKSNIETLVLENISAHIPTAVFEELKKSVKVFLVANSQLNYINMATFKDMANMDQIELRGNNIKSMEVISGNSISNNKLTYFVIEANTLPFLPNNVFTGYNSLQTIKIIDNKIELKLDTEALSRLSPSVNTLYLDRCNVRELPQNVFLGASNVHKISINDNLIEEIHSNVFSTTKSVRRMTLSGNKIKSLPEDVFSNMKKLEYLDLSGNNIKKLSRRLFEHNTQLNTLLLQENNITELDTDVFRGKPFQSVSLAVNRLQNVDNLGFLETSSWDTKELNLSHNQIDTFHNWFVKLPKLEDLDLSWNKIKRLSNEDLHTHRPSNLKINLQNNEISFIVNDGSLPVKEENKIILYLSKNPLDCDCQSIKNIHELNNRNIIADFEQLTCNNGDNVSTIDVFLLCNKRHAQVALIGTSVFATLFGFFVLVSIVNTWRKAWKYISINILHRRTDSEYAEMEKEAMKKYDLFISFAHEDSEFVKTNLLPKLEFEYGQKVCIHYRDWLVGQPIPDQIIKSVENSRMTIIILTEDFLMSEWSYLEFRTAHNLSQQEGKSRVIIILLNESITNDERLHIDIKSYLAISSYLVWNDPYFWVKLEKRMSKNGIHLNIYEKRNIFV